MSLVSYTEWRALLFWFCCMTLLGCVPVENLAETGSNVKSAVESRTEQESLKRRLDVLKKKKKRYDGYSIFLSFNDGFVMQD